jgi:hypothetical protein
LLWLVHRQSVGLSKTDSFSVKLAIKPAYAGEMGARKLAPANSLSTNAGIDGIL